MALLGAGVFVGILLWRAAHYEAEQLRGCLRDLQNPSPVIQRQAQERLRALGPNTVPALQRMLHARDLPGLTNFMRFAQQQSLVRIPFVPARQRRIRAAMACVVLGADAVPALPDLIAFSAGDGYCFNLAQSALGQFGPGAIRPLTLALTNRDSNVRLLVLGALVHVGPGVETAAPEMLKCLRDDSANVRLEAARALGRVRTASPNVARGLAEALEDPDGRVREAAAAALEGYGTQIVPALSDLENDPSPTVRSNAIKTLVAIRHQRER